MVKDKLGRDVRKGMQVVVPRNILSSDIIQAEVEECEVISIVSAGGPQGPPHVKLVLSFKLVSPHEIGSVLPFLYIVDEKPAVRKSSSIITQ